MYLWPDTIVRPILTPEAFFSDKSHLINKFFRRHEEEIVDWAVSQLVGPGSSCQRKQLEVNNLKTQVNVEVNLQKGTQMKTL